MQVIKSHTPHYNEYKEYVKQLAERGLVNNITFEYWLKINKYDNGNNKTKI